MKTITKKILIILITIITLSNFVMPNYIFGQSTSSEIETQEEDTSSKVETQKEAEMDKNESETKNKGEAANKEKEEKDKENAPDIDLSGKVENIIEGTEEKEEKGGVLFAPISQFLLTISDGVMATLQGAFMGSEKIGNIINPTEIKIYSPEDKATEFGDSIINSRVERYSIRYSPAAIFSGSIPALDVNFFSPMGDEEGKVKFYNVKTDFEVEKNNVTYKECRENYGATANLQSIKDKKGVVQITADVMGVIMAINAFEAFANTDNDIDYGTYGGGATGGALTFIAGGSGTASVPIPEFDFARINKYGSFYSSKCGCIWNCYSGRVKKSKYLLYRMDE